jgi:hypothetical protein
MHSLALLHYGTGALEWHLNLSSGRDDWYHQKLDAACILLNVSSFPNKYIMQSWVIAYLTYTFLLFTTYLKVAHKR